MEEQNLKQKVDPPRRRGYNPEIYAKIQKLLKRSKFGFRSILALSVFSVLLTAVVLYTIIITSNWSYTLLLTLIHLLFVSLGFFFCALGARHGNTMAISVVEIVFILGVMFIIIASITDMDAVRANIQIHIASIIISVIIITALESSRRIIIKLKKWEYYTKAFPFSNRGRSRTIVGIVFIVLATIFQVIEIFLMNSLDGGFQPQVKDFEQVVQYNKPTLQKDQSVEQKDQSVESNSDRMFHDVERTMSEETLNRLKNATVFIKDSYSQYETTGTGFLFKKDGKNGYIATNAHVVSNAREKVGIVDVVFNSSLKNENSLVAKIVAYDDQSDLAILKILMKNLPQGIIINDRLKLHETMSVFILGFPFGESLSLTTDNPAITVSQGAISSIRYDKYGDVGLVQIDGNVNPGNSGGPIVDVSGNLIGIAVSKVEGTQIGFAVPATQLDHMLRGRISSITLEEIENTNGRLKLKLNVSLINPLNTIEQVSVLIAPKESINANLKADHQGVYGPFSKSRFVKEYELTIEDLTASCIIELSGKPNSNKVYYHQVKYTRTDSLPIYMEPAEYTASFNLGGNLAMEQPESGSSWLGSPSQSKNSSKKTEPLKVLKTGESLADRKRIVVDANVVSINLNNQIPNMLWSSNRKSLITLSKNGILRKISIPGFKEKQKVIIDHECNGLAVSSEGIVVLSKSLQELLLFKESNFKLEKRIPVAGARSITASPELAIVFIGMGDELSAVDLKQGYIVKTYSARKIYQEAGRNGRKHKDSLPMIDFIMPTLSPDGRYLLCVSLECLHRFKVKGVDLTYEESGPRIGQNPKRLEISSDSAYVALPSGGGNYIISDHPDISSYGIYIYPINNLGMPIIGITPGAYPIVLGMDEVGGKLYSCDYEHQLIVFNTTGNKLKEYVLSKRGDEVEQILPHPKGNKLLVLTEGGLFWVELPS